MVMAIIPKWYLFVSFRFRMGQIWSTIVSYSCSLCSYLATFPPHLCHPLRTIEVREGVCQATCKIGESAGGHPWNRKSCFEEWCLFKAYLVQSQCHNHCFWKNITGVILQVGPYPFNRVKWFNKPLNTVNIFQKQWHCPKGPPQEGLGDGWRVSNGEPSNFRGSCKGGWINCASIGYQLDGWSIFRRTRMPCQWWSLCAHVGKFALLWCAVSSSLWLVHHIYIECPGNLSEEWGSSACSPQPWTSCWKDTCFEMFWSLTIYPQKNIVPRIYGCCFTVILHKDIFKVSLGFLQPLQEKQMQGRKRWRCRQRRAWWCDDGHQKGWARWRWRRWCTSRAVMQSGGCGHQRHEVQAGEALLHIS